MDAVTPQPEQLAGMVGAWAITGFGADVPRMRWHIARDQTGLPALSWDFDQKVLDAASAVDGWYALVTTVPPERADPAPVLIHHKGQGESGCHYHDVKGPFAVTPIFV